MAKRQPVESVATHCSSSKRRVDEYRRQNNVTKKGSGMDSNFFMVHYFCLPEQSNPHGIVHKVVTTFFPNVGF